MKAKHHFWSSIVAGGALYWVTGSSAALAGSMLGGFFIDIDHVIDQSWSIVKGAPLMKSAASHTSAINTKGEAHGRLAGYLRRRKLVRLPLIFHSFELLAALIILTAYFRTPFMIGLAAGYGLHLSLDLIRHYHEFRSPFFYLILYRSSHGFRRDRLIKSEYL
ncbi:MAG: hypothetical protein WBV94_00685 [Blastocatellia bacterium]